MKKIIISWLFCLVTVCLFGQDFCMYFQGKKVYYKVSATKILVKFEKFDTNSIKDALQRTVIGSPRNIQDLGDQLFMIEMQNLSKENLLKLQNQWSSREDVIYTSPVFVDERGLESSSYTNEVIVGLKSKNDYPVLQKSAKVYSIKDIKPLGFDVTELTYILTLPHNSKKDAAEISIELYETGLFEYAHPNILTLWPLASNDTYFNNQWGLKNTGQSGGTAGMDIKAELAWTITTGSSSRKIAILDTGVDLSHPDLVNNLLSGYDATGNNTNGAPIINATTLLQDFSHGTKCAGVVAAQGNNSKGIIGVAYGCKILPVTVGTAQSIPAAYVVAGINWAVNNGADVISMSFNTSNTSAMITAINNAVTSGRSNKGCVLVACAHNQGQPNVTFPASSDKVIAVGTLTRNGQRRSDSNYGTNLNVLAPGEYIYTTGMTGSGRNDTINDGANGVYYSNFNATSAATPHVAGIAALVLSVNSNLTAQEVRDIIDMTAQKLDGYIYQTTSAHPNGSWNNETGYGLVDAQAAVQAATCTNSLANQTISANKFARNCNSSFPVQNVTVTG
ncbi:MAG: S8 family serine peptidase, partial [Prevotellaceae bacterium]|nr:S8 family serine peptidase [Prevotellaceae bacterium]